MLYINETKWVEIGQNGQSFIICFQVLTIQKKIGSCWYASLNCVYLIPVEVQWWWVIISYVLMTFCCLCSFTVAKNRGFHGSVNKDCDLVNYNVVYFHRWYWTGWRNLLYPSSSTPNIQAAGRSKILFTMDKNMWLHNHRRQQS